MKCSDCHIYRIAAEKKFLAAYPGFQPIRKWQRTTDEMLWRWFTNDPAILGGSGPRRTFLVVIRSDGVVEVRKDDSDNTLVTVLP